MSNSDRLQQILDIGIALTAERNPDKLLAYILNTAMELTNADGGTLYIVKGEFLEFRIMKTKSKGIDFGNNGEKIDIPPVPLKPENLCAYSAINKIVLNIEDAYESDFFDFSGPKRYDAMNDYRTKSMVTIPMINSSDEVLGVMQLINATTDGRIRKFSKDEEKVLLSLASQAAISLSNMSYLDELNKQMWSFTEALTEVIDARTPYNASHTRKVAEYSGLIVDYINKMHEEGKEYSYFSKEDRDRIIMAALLHDIGKIVVPIGVMNKKTRLDKYKERILNRIEVISLKIRIDYLENKINEETYETMKNQIDDILDIVEKTDTAVFIDDELLKHIERASKYKYISPDCKEVIPFLSYEEIECMKIRRGTLSDSERKIMENHVVMTERILSKVHFNKKFAEASKWASEHHECINGSGYPKQIEGHDLCIESRILAVADICDALLATDRPYKKPMPKEKAFSIMYDMASEGKIERRFVEYLEKQLS